MAMNVVPVTLENDLVRLEPLMLKHASGLFNIGQEAEDWAYLPRPCFQSLADTEEWILQAHRFLEQGEHISFAIIDRRSGLIAGSTRFLNIRAQHYGLEIGYSWLGRNFQGSHVNIAAKLCLLQHAFDQLHCLRVELKTDARNHRSQAAIKRLGAQQEGILRQHMIAQENFIRDSVMFSITHIDWPEVKANLTSKLIPR